MPNPNQAIKKENEPIQVENPTELVRDDGEVEGYQKEEGKFKLVLSILKQCIGVKDIASLRFSLPAQLLEPVGNLEYWNYVDRPDYFAVMGDSDDELERMLGVLRWWFTKDLRFVRGRVVKPYNSVLGEFFRCKWVVTDPTVREDHTLDPDSSQLPTYKTEYSETTKFPLGKSYRPKASRTASSQSVASTMTKSSTKTSKKKSSKKNSKSESNQDSSNDRSSTAPSTAESNNEHLSPSQKSKHSIVFMAEQTSHHPAVSAFYVTCPSKGIEVYGQDQIAVGFTGTSFKVCAGDLNKGVYVRFNKRDNEEYLCTHPSASVGGILRGNLHINLLDSTVILCPKTRIKTIITYIEERWLGKPRSLVEGVCYRYDPSNDTIDSIKAVPKENILATFKGNWRNCIFYSYAGESESRMLVDLNELDLVHKRCPPLDKQFPFESRKIWFPVTHNILAKHYTQATKAKQEIEDQQRQASAAREESNTEWKPRFFVPDEKEGRPTLTEEGKKVLEQSLSDEYIHGS